MSQFQMVKKFLLCSVVFVCLAAAGQAQDFGFGDLESSGASGNPGPVKIGGEVSAGFKGFFGDFHSPKAMGATELGDIFSGSLEFSVSGAAAEGIISLDIAPSRENAFSVDIGEAYVRAFFGPVNVEGGFRKLTWGKADSFGPLDLINPLDYSDLSELTDPQAVKIARPMIHVSWNMGAFSKLEAVFVPWFQGHSFATSGPWTPAQIGGLIPALSAHPMASSDLSQLDIDKYYQDRKTTLEYAQAGTRFTTSAGSSDFGFQYYFGRLPRPAVEIDITKLNASPNFDGLLNIDYNQYHHIGVDFARVVAGFNLRAEAGANITSDTGGSDGAVYNPALVWSLGFDRDLFLAVNLNLQGSGSVRLFYDEVGGSQLEDVEAGKDRTSTRITAKLSRKFFMDELELNTTGLWGIEDRDFLIMPGIVWSRGDLSVELSAGFFGGDRDGELGQYRDNGFIKTLLSYKF
jgi:hypothetical protein